MEKQIVRTKAKKENKEVTAVNIRNNEVLNLNIAPKSTLAEIEKKVIEGKRDRVRNYLGEPPPPSNKTAKSSSETLGPRGLQEGPRCSWAPSFHPRAPCCAYCFQS